MSSRFAAQEPPAQWTMRQQPAAANVLVISSDDSRGAEAAGTTGTKTHGLGGPGTGSVQA